MVRWVNLSKLVFGRVSGYWAAGLLVSAPKEAKRPVLTTVFLSIVNRVAILPGTNIRSVRRYILLIQCKFLLERQD